MTAPPFSFLKEFQDKHCNCYNQRTKRNCKVLTVLGILISNHSQCEDNCQEAKQNKQADHNLLTNTNNGNTTGIMSFGPGSNHCQLVLELEHIVVRVQELFHVFL